MDRYGDEHQPALLSYGFFVVSIFHNVANQLMQLQCELAQTSCYLPEKNYQELATQLAYVSEVIRHSQEILKSGKSQVEDFPLLPLLHKTKRLCQLTLQREHIHCQILCSDAIRLSGDKIVLQQIFLNLFLNSVEALRTVSPDKRWISVQAQTQKQHTIITISDTGPGFPLDNTQNCLQPFVSYRKAGVGLGLSYVCEQMQKTFHGSIQIANRRIGSQIQLLFPRIKSQPSTSPTNPGWEETNSHVQ